VVAINEELEDTPSLVNESPQDGGWFVQIEIDDESQLAELMDEAAYTTYCEEEAH
jgi:glycine cleavage system H protein